MYHMRRASVRDLRYSFKDVEASLAAGEPIEIVKRNRVIAHLVPVAPPKPPIVDFEAQLKRIWGDKIPEISLLDLLLEEREES
jgi:antitoxin (DNA-binding transcriptional repressor) of toxin-antitoxin stability system